MHSGIIRYNNYRRWFLYHLLKQKLLLLLVLIGIVIVTLSRVLIPLIIGYIIDNALINRNDDLFLLLTLMFTVYIVRNATDYITMMIGHYLGLKTEQNMRQEFFDILQNKPLRYHDKARTGDLQALATNDLRVINTMVSHGSFYIYPFIQIFLVIFFLFTTLDLRLAGIIFPFILIYIYFSFDYAKKIAPYAAARMVKHSDLSVTLQDSLSGIAVIKAFTAEKFERNKFQNAVIGYRNNRVGEARVQSKFYSLLVIYVAIGFTFLVSILFAYDGSISIGTLTAANLLLVTLIDPTGMIFWATNDALSGFAACSRLFNSLLIENEEENNNESKKWPENFKGKIEFRNVTFFYENNGNQRPILDNVSFVIEPNTQIALVGPTGCGKTTLAKLLLRLYEPQEGTILLDGIDIKEYPIESLRRNVGYVEQDIYLFSRTIGENISFGKPEATHEEIIEAAKLSQVDEFVQKFPNKYETIVGERGTRLSGGEKQRVAIARALLTNPGILILDDSVSAVDSETEEKITRAIENVTSNRTTLIITHRLHTIRKSDKILTLKQGKVVADGTHNELLNTSVDYRRIFGKNLILPEIKSEIRESM